MLSFFGSQCPKLEHTNLRCSGTPPAFYSMDAAGSSERPLRLGESSFLIDQLSDEKNIVHFLLRLSPARIITMVVGSGLAAEDIQTKNAWDQQYKSYTRLLRTFVEYSFPAIT